MTNNDIMITDITDEKRRYLALISLRVRLRTELRGMKFTNRGASTLTICTWWGYKGKKSKQKALIWVEDEIQKILDKG